MPVRCDGVERAITALEAGFQTGEVLPAFDRHIDVTRVQLDGVAGPAGHFTCNQRGAGSVERLVDGLARA